MITYLLNTLVDSIKTSLINKLGLDPSTEVDLDDFPQLIDDIPILDSVEELTVTENGTYTGTDGVTYNPVNVNLPLGSKSVTANGTYTASDDSLQGYSSVTVDIDDTDLYRDTTDSTYESVKTLSNCGAFPMLSLKVGIEAVQSGSGDPSPSNVRPISGWSAVDVSVRGVNLFDKTTIIQKAYINNSTGALINSIASWSDVLNASDWISVTPNTAYYHNTGGQSSSNYLAWYDINKNYISGQGSHSSSIITSPPNAYFLRITVHDDYVNSCSVNYPSTDTEYHAYNGTTYTIDLDGTRYGGTLDVVSGVLTLTHGYIASYNGETLPSTWISDRDVYAEGTTPSTGAEVVYELATPTTIQLTPTQVKSLLGTNNIWADTGDVGDVRYFKKVEL